MTAYRYPSPSSFRRRAPRLSSAAVIAGLLSLGLASPGTAAAQEAVPTRIVVRVVANDAKIIGSGVGGAWVVIRDQRTGAVLAQGLQEGGTGDTGRIMGTRERGATTFDTDGAAAFRAELPLTEPTPVVIEYRAPLGTPHAMQTGSTSLLLVPGAHLDGEGILVTLYGFTVELLSPDPSAFQAPAGSDVPVRARVTMLCGCPTEPGGMWDSSSWEIRAQWVRGGKVLGEGALEFSGTRNEYAGSLAAPAEGGPVTLRVLAVDRARANTGMAAAPGLIR